MDKLRVTALFLIAFTLMGASVPIGTYPKNPDTRLYDWPKELSLRDGTVVMFENLWLKAPFIFLLPSGEIGNDYLLDKHPEKSKEYGFESGYWGVKDSQEIENEIMLIDGPANLRNRPGERIIDSWPDRTVARTLKKKGEWRLVSDRKNQYGWTHIKNLKPLPKGKILLDPTTPVAREWPALVKARIKLEREIKKTRKILAEGKCPENLTDAERDRLMGAFMRSSEPDPINEGTLINLRQGAFENCPEGKKPFTPEPMPSPVPKMRVASCDCFDEQPMEGTRGAKVDPAQWEGYPKESCSKLQKHYQCTDPGAGEGDLGGTLSCPISCF